MITQAHIYVKGDVIGVGFRAWTKIQAKIHGVRGWVRNNHEKKHVFGPNGGVEALLQGEEHDVEKMIEEVKKGSPVSHVEEVDVFWQPTAELFDTFDIRK